jgi:hypothetical protein
MLVIIGLRPEYRPLIQLQRLGHSGFIQPKYLAITPKKGTEKWSMPWRSEVGRFYFLTAQTLCFRR